jgi:hypothetical protein
MSDVSRPARSGEDVARETVVGRHSDMAEGGTGLPGTIRAGPLGGNPNQRTEITDVMATAAAAPRPTST